jgi:hypothetical protein
VKKRQPVVLVKADGSDEAFSLRKLQSRLETIMQTANRDPWLAEPLAKAVASHIRERNRQGAPSTEYIFQCVVSVLRQTQLGDVADRMCGHRRRRREMRKRIRVIDFQKWPHSEKGWNKGEVYEWLRSRHGVGDEAARVLAGRIEEQVFRLGYHKVSATLIAELGQSEMMAWGLVDAAYVGLAAVNVEAETPPQGKLIRPESSPQPGA